jgi:hypothetical protein
MIRLLRGLLDRSPVMADDPSPLDLADGVGLTRGQRAWLQDQYPAGTVEWVEATVRAANEVR